MPLRIVYFGSPQFAVPALRSLADDGRFAVTDVVTQPDRRSGRGRRVSESPVKIAAHSLGIPIWQPETLKTSEALERLSQVETDVFVVVAYGELFGRGLLALPKFGCLNVHPSLLPRYRGSSPIQRAILNGDPETGVSVIRMIRALDAGPLVAQAQWPLSGTETGESLSQDLAELTVTMLPDVVAAWSNREIEEHAQDNSAASYTHELTKADGFVDWLDDAATIERQVRAYWSWPTAWTSLNQRRLVIVACEVDEGRAAHDPGSIWMDQRDVYVSCGTRSIRLLRVQPEGKASMAADAWFRGLRVEGQLRFDRPSANG